MPEPKVHFLNVKDGDCFIIERPSGRITMIDICCGNLDEGRMVFENLVERKTGKPLGNYGMRDWPTNPINYLTKRGISEIFRFILTHPDMDHMDGIKRLFEEKSVTNYWDCGVRKNKPDFNSGGSYLEDDWDFYEKLINGKIYGTTIVAPRAGSIGRYYNVDNDDGSGYGDYLSVISPCQELIDSANDDGDINDASYVIVYRCYAGKIIFPGDSNDKTWEFILENHNSLVKDAAVLFAPHHGRESDRDYSFLDVVNPRVSFFGCAPSEHLAYSAWQYRDLLYFTNNQCGNVHIYPENDKMNVYIENPTYANDYTRGQTYQRDDHWFLCSV